MRTIVLTLGAGIAALLTACGSAKDASEGNFKKIIDAHYAKDCIAVQPDGGFGVDSETFPVTIELEPVKHPNQAERNAEKLAQFEALAKAGLLSVKDTQVQGKGGLWGHQGQMLDAKEYALTDAGRASYQETERTRARKTGEFCAGHYAVDAIKRFTEPGSLGPYTASEVSYTYSPQNVPAWANNPAVRAAIPQLDRQLQERQEGRAVMILTNEGWVHEKDFQD